jgi:nicotinamidase-related amidase
MHAHAYPLRTTALLMIDPFNDFLAAGGKLWPYLKQNAERVGLLANLRRVLHAARSDGLTVVYVPHRRYEPSDFDGWKFLNPTHQKVTELHTFERNSWGAEFHPDLQPQQGDVLASEHWMHSGFANTDLDQHLRARGIDHIALAGMRTNACFEATARYGVELGYHVTLIADATAAFRREEMEATFLNAAAYVHAVLSTETFVGSLGAARDVAAAVAARPDAC